MSGVTPGARPADDFQKKRFDRAAATYGRHSAVQERMASCLVELLPEEFAPKSVVEFGCGTGHLTRALVARWPRACYLATDGSSGMVEACRMRLEADFPPVGTAGHRRFEIVDARAFDLAGSFDLAASNALVQWFPDLNPHFAAVAAALAPQGLCLVSGFCRGHFPELNALLAEPPFSYPEAVGHALEDVAAALEAAGLSVLACQAEEWCEAYRDPAAFLASIQGTGASRRPDGARMSRVNLRRLLEGYADRFSVEGGVCATWKPWFALARKERRAA